MKQIGLVPARTLCRMLPAGALMLVLGACSTDLSSINLLPKDDNLLNSRLTYGGAQIPNQTTRPLTAADFVDANGQCPAEEVVESADGAAPVVSGGIALQMSECQVVRRAGAPDRVEAGTNERGERAVTLTYLRGAWPGIYRFSEGRLTVMERVAEPASARQRAPRSRAKS